MAGDVQLSGYLRFYAPEPGTSGMYNVAIYVNGEYHAGGPGHVAGTQISPYALELANLKCFTVSGWVERTS